MKMVAAAPVGSSSSNGRLIEMAEKGLIDEVCSNVQRMQCMQDDAWMPLVFVCVRGVVHGDENRIKGKKVVWQLQTFFSFFSSFLSFTSFAKTPLLIIFKIALILPVNSYL